MSLRYGVEAIPAMYGGYHWAVIDRDQQFRRVQYASVRTALNSVSMHSSEEEAQDVADSLNALNEL
jgi:hypothetical protein